MTGSNGSPRPSLVVDMFSLIIPAYNRGALLPQTLRSALAQTVPFREIIVVDDGSTDDTAQAVAQFGDRIRYIRTENQGVQKARNVGVDAAMADRVAFCDSDDLLDPEYVEVMSTWLASHPDTDVTYTNFSTFDARPWYPDKFFAAPPGYFDGAEINQGFYVNVPDLYIKSIRYPCMWVTGMTVKTAFYQRIGGFDPSFRRVVTEDWEFNLRAIANGHVALYRRPLVRVRYHTGSQSDSSVRLHLGAAKVLKHCLEQHPPASRYEGEILQEIERHSGLAFNAAFAAGDFAHAKQALTQPHLHLAGAKFEVKKKIVKLPHPLRLVAWQITQWASPRKRAAT